MVWRACTIDYINIGFLIHLYSLSVTYWPLFNGKKISNWDSMSLFRSENLNKIYSLNFEKFFREKKYWKKLSLRRFLISHELILTHIFSDSSLHHFRKKQNKYFINASSEKTYSEYNIWIHSSEHFIDNLRSVDWPPHHSEFLFLLHFERFLPRIEITFSVLHIYSFIGFQTESPPHNNCGTNVW